MISELAELHETLSGIYPGAALPPKPLHLVRAMVAVRADQQTLGSAAVASRTTRHHLAKFVGSSDPVEALLGPLPAFDLRMDEKYRSTLGSLLIGAVAERVFLELWDTSTQDTGLELVDDRLVRGDTDFFVRDHSNRQVFRLNIKFHGSQFRNAETLVGLPPDDCFALATYKIHGALVRQDAEHLPYVFVVIGVPGLTGSVVGETFPERAVRLVAAVHHSRKVASKRSIEDALIQRVVDSPRDFGMADSVADHFEAIRSATWRVLSARRADRLLREMLFERAYALRVRGFAQNYRGAELDMHFSLKSDLHALDELFTILRADGMAALASRLERGSL